ncbi:capsular exopolysaccharide family [Polaribacter sp. KT25b]|uniref:GumC family protein n=1 Tax=Polaribacter sp. KT25b TaxID=1855336 RepID=UPI00087AE816|nr:polysaccharide biosynthesis tyrosine autokinase [Polaribacter sp. KT25b]SDS15032.1 capsular exopolysaccharide family [Polaribacter sp. KT25b]
MKEFQKNNQEIIFEDNDKINLKEEFDKYVYYWRWFVLALCISFCCAYYYIKKTPPLYNASAYIMIKDNLKSGISDELKAVSDLGIVGNNSTNNPENEIFIIKSRKIVSRVVDSLELNISYFDEQGRNAIEAYKNSAIKVDFLNDNTINSIIDTSFVVSFTEKNRFSIKDSEGEILKSAYFDEIITSDNLGSFKITKNLLDKDIDTDQKDILVVVRPKKNVVSSYASRIIVSAVSEFSSILKLEIKDANKSKAEDILNELIKQYNLDALIDKNEISKKTKEFIEERLQNMSVELGVIQDKLKDFKTDFGISGFSKQAEIAFESISSYDEVIVRLKTQLTLVEWAENDLKKHTKSYEILPENLGFSDEITSKAINEYNQLVLEQQRLRIKAGDKNPSLVLLQNRIQVLRENVYRNLENLKSSINIQLNKSLKESKVAQTKVAQIPLIERGMIDIQRQKAIYSELYSYLLRKKEETAISLAVTVSNAKIIDVAYSSDGSISPKKKIIYLIALVVGLIIPFLLIYLKFILDTKIHNRKDIESNLNIPYLGDIPNSVSLEKIIVKKETRTSTAEAFRLLRANLSFMLPKTGANSKGKTIFITSTISGEGKSFVSLNLAATMALTNKKVLLLGLDLRAPKITDYLELPDRKGVTNYILDDKLTLKELIFNVSDIDNLDIISSGLIPPNPSELLLNDRVKNLLEIAKNEYDFIIVDTAPVSLVSDTLLIGDLADMFLYVTRANYLDKRMLIVPETLYKEKKLPNMAIVLNSTDSSRGYGYGYGYIEKEKKSFYKRILGK